MKRGFILADAAMALAIIAMLATALALAANRQRAAAVKLSNTRAAVRLAEESLATLRAGRKPGANVAIRSLEGEAPAKGLAWIEVTADVEGQRASLIGAIKEGDVK